MALRIQSKDQIKISYKQIQSCSESCGFLIQIIKVEILLYFVNG